MRDGDEKEVGRDGDGLRDGGVQRGDDALDVRLRQLVVQQEDVLLEAQQCVDVELRDRLPVQVDVGQITLATGKRARMERLDDGTEKDQDIQVMALEVQVAEQTHHHTRLLDRQLVRRPVQQRGHVLQRLHQHRIQTLLTHRPHVRHAHQFADHHEAPLDHVVVLRAHRHDLRRRLLKIARDFVDFFLGRRCVFSKLALLLQVLLGGVAVLHDGVVIAQLQHAQQELKK